MKIWNHAYKVLKTCSFVSYCNILTANRFHKRRSCNTHEGCLLAMIRCHSVLDDIYKILHTVVYCLGEFQSETIEVS